MNLDDNSVQHYRNLLKREKRAGFDLGVGPLRFFAAGKPHKSITQGLRGLESIYSSPGMAGVGHGLTRPLESLGMLFSNKGAGAQQILKDLKMAEGLKNRAGAYTAKHGAGAVSQADDVIDAINKYRSVRGATAGLAGLGGAGALAYHLQKPEEQQKLPEVGYV